MKKGTKIFGLLVILFVSLFLMSISLISAAPTSFADNFAKLITGTIDTFKKAGTPLFDSLFGQTGESAADLFIKVLVFLLVVTVIVSITGLIPAFSDKPWAQVIIGIIVSIIGIRFLPTDFIKQLAFPSSAFVATIFFGIPFVLFMWLMTRLNLGTYWRRAGWTIFGGIIFILWVYNWENNQDTFLNYVYPFFILACILAFMFDGILQKFLRRGKTERVIEKSKSKELNRAKAALSDLRVALGNAQTSTERAEIKGEITQQLANIRAIEQM